MYACHNYNEILEDHFKILNETLQNKNGMTQSLMHTAILEMQKN